MSKGRSVVLGAAVAAAAAAGTALGYSVSGAFADALFLAVIAAALTLTVWWAARSAVEARREQAVARREIATPDDELVARAVAIERRQLSQDIDRELRSRLALIAQQAASSDTDLGAVARAVHLSSREATSELRRRLGLLREDEGVPVTGEPARGSAVAAAGSAGRVPTMGASAARTARGLVYAALAMVLAGVEAVVYPLIEGGAPAWTSVAASVLAAASLVWLRRSPALAAAICAAVWGQSALTGIGVVGGFWVLATLGPVSYSLVAYGRGRSAWPAGVALVAGVAVGSTSTDSGNTGINLVTIGVGMLAGAAVRLARGRAVAARRARHARDDQVRPAVEAALRSQRGTMARELHDTVSHAVGVVAMQAAAAEVLWPEHPERVRAALDVAAHTAEGALAELDAVGAGEAPPVTVVALVDRFRAAGLRVDAQVAPVPAALEPLVARIVQEALTNVVRHSHAAAASVTVDHDVSGVCVRVVDDGESRGRGGDGSRDGEGSQGSSRGPVDAHPGFGLTGLRERVALAGGTFRAGSGSREKGFAVTAQIPVATPLARAGS